MRNTVLGALLFVWSSCISVQLGAQDAPHSRLAELPSLAVGVGAPGAQEAKATLVEAGAPGVHAILETIRDHPRDWTLKRALFTLLEEFEAPAAPALLECVDDPNRTIAEACVRALEKLGPKAAGCLPTLFRWEGLEPDVETARRRSAASSVIREIDYAAVPFLREKMRSGSSEEAERARSLLKRVRLRRGVTDDELVHELKNRTGGLSRIAAYRLSEQGSNFAVTLAQEVATNPALLDVLKSMGARGKPAAPYVEQRLLTKLGHVGRTEIHTLRAIAPERFPAILERCAEQARSEHARTECEWRLGRGPLSDVPDPTLPELAEWIRTPEARNHRSRFKALLEVGSEAEPILLEGLDHAKPAVRLTAYETLFALYRSTGKSLHAVIQQGLEEDDLKIRQVALNAVLEDGAPERLALLRVAMSDPNRQVHTPALKKFARVAISTTSLWDELVDWTDRLGPPGIQVLSGMLLDCRSQRTCCLSADSQLFVSSKAGRLARVLMRGLTGDFGDSWRTADILAELGEHAHPYLIDAVGEKNSERLPVVMYALESSRVPSPEAVPALLSFVPGEEDVGELVEWVESPRGYSWGCHGTHGIPLHDEMAIGELAICAIASMGEAALPALEKALRRGNTLRRWRAVRMLLEFEESASPVLPTLFQAALRERDPALRELLAYAVGLLGGEHPEALPTLLQLSGHEDPRTRDRAREALLSLSYSLREQALAELEERGPSLGTFLAVVATSRQEPGAVLATVAPYLESEDPELRASAINAIGNNPGLVYSEMDRLFPLLSDSNPAVRRETARAFRHLWKNQAYAVPPLVASMADPTIRDDLAAVLAGYAGASRPALEEALNHEDHNMRVGAIKALLGIYLPESVEGNWARRAGAPVKRFSELLDDPHPEVRVAAVEALGRLGGKSRSATARMKELLKDPDPSVRAKAAWALEEIPEASAPSGTPAE